MGIGIIKGKVLWREKKAIQAMIKIYCQGERHVHQKRGYCESCEKLLLYANERLDKCVFGEEKPVCARCLVHCYHPAMGREIARVMRYAGPKMLLRHPYLAIRHLLIEKKPSEQLQKILERKKNTQQSKTCASSV